MHTLIPAACRSSRRAAARRRQRGAALLLAIWLSGAAAALALAFTARTSPPLESGFLEVETLRADILASNGLHHAAALIANGRVVFDSIPVRITLETGADVASIEIRPESGKLDLNAAPPESVRHLFVELGVGGDAASGAVLELVRLRETTLPRAAARSSSPTLQASQAPAATGVQGSSDILADRVVPEDRVTLSSLAVLNLLPGLSPVIREDLADHVTVATGSALPERTLASEPVRRALLGSGEATQSEAADRLRQPASDALDKDPNGLYGLSISVRIGQKIRRQRRALVWLPEEGDALFHILDWSAPGRFRDPPTASPGDTN